MGTSASFERLQQLANQQYGVFTVQQAAAVGVGEEELEALRTEGQLRRLVEGAYKIRGFEGEHGEGAYALWLMLDPATLPEQRQAQAPDCGVLSHSSAALWLDPFSFDGEALSVTYPNNADLSGHLDLRSDRIRIYRSDMSSSEWFVYDGVPVTTPARTVMDLLDDFDEDETSVGRMLNGMNRAGVVDFRELASQLNEYAYREEYGDGEKLVELLRHSALPGGASSRS